MRGLPALLAACAALAAAGCGDDSHTGGVSFAPYHAFQATCDESGSGVCTTYVSGYSQAELASQRTMCSAAGWSTTAACPAAGRIGRCTTTQGGLTWSNDYYPGFGSDAATLAVGCINLGGAWSAN